MKRHVLNVLLILILIDMTFLKIVSVRGDFIPVARNAKVIINVNILFFYVFLN